MKFTIFSITFLVLALTVIGSGFFLYTGNVAYNVDSYKNPNLVLDSLYFTKDKTVTKEDTILVNFCNNGNRIINNEVSLDLEIEGKQLSPTILEHSKIKTTKTYNLIGFGRKCLQDKIKISEVIGKANFVDSVVRARVYTKNNLPEIRYDDNVYETGYYTFDDGLKVKRVNKYNIGK